MRSLSEKFEFIRDGMNVRRYHQYPTLEIDTVGKHSCGVALTAFLINPDVSKNALIAAITHDLGESVTGDIPSPTKKRLTAAARDQLDNIELEALNMHDFPTDLLTDEEVILLKVCDYLDGLAFCCEELNRGNRGIRRVAENYIIYIREFMDHNRGFRWMPRAESIYRTLTNAWSSNYVR